MTQLGLVTFFTQAAKKTIITGKFHVYPGGLCWIDKCINCCGSLLANTKNGTNFLLTFYLLFIIVNLGRPVSDEK